MRTSDENDRARRHFFDVVERLTRSQDPAQQARLKLELARLTFGQPANKMPR